MDTAIVENSLLTAVIPIKPSLKDRENVISWLSDVNAEKVHFILVFDRPTPEMRLANRDLPSQFPKMKIDIVEGEFFGPGPARNAGIKIVRSKYVAFWDSDDQPNFQVIISTLSENRLKAETILVGDFDIKITNLEPRRLQTFNLVDLSRHPGLWRCIIPASALQNCEFPSLLLGEDQVFLSRVLMSNEKIQFIQKPFYTYMYGGTEQLTSLKDFSDLLKSERILAQSISKDNSKEILNFVANLSSKNLLTVLRRGKVNQRLEALYRLLSKIITNSNGGFSSVLLMARVPKKARFNV